MDQRETIDARLAAPEPALTASPPAEAPTPDAVERTESGFREMLSTAREAILMSDADGNVVFANRAATQAFGFTAQELIGISLDALVPGRPRERAPTERAQPTTNRPATSIERSGTLVGKRKDGSTFPIEMALGSMARADAPLLMSFITDITKQLESEHKIRGYQQKLQRMAFDAAVGEERERRRIAADLHDRIGQSLALAQIKLTSMRDAVQGAPRIAIDQAIELLAQSVIDTRTLTFELSPPVLYDLGLKDALSWLAEDVEKRQGLRIELHDDELEKPLDDATASLVFRAARELLMNVFKHAKVLTAHVSLRRSGDQFEIDVKDQGVGFDPEDSTLHSTGGGFGLFSVREQIRSLGGSVDVTSAPQHGTCVSLRVPLKLKVPARASALTGKTS